MSLTLDEYRSKLIGKILSSSSREDVKRFCDAGVKGLEYYKVHSHIITRFIDKTIMELEAFRPMDKNDRLWSNINTAKVSFNQIRLRINPSVN